MTRIKEVLMRRDGMSASEAGAEISDAKEQLQEYLEGVTKQEGKGVDIEKFKHQALGALAGFVFFCLWGLLLTVLHYLFF